MVARGITSGCRSISFCRLASLVTPAIEENSPPAMVVGTLIWRTVGGCIAGETPPWVRIVSMPSDVVTLLARQSCTALAPSVIEPTITSVPPPSICWTWMPSILASALYFLALARMVS